MHLFITSFIAFGGFLIAASIIFFSIRDISTGWVIFWFLHIFIWGLMLATGIYLVEFGFDLKGPDRTVPYVMMAVIMFFEFIIAAMFRTAFITTFLYWAQSGSHRKKSKASIREKTEQSFLTRAW